MKKLAIALTALAAFTAPAFAAGGSGWFGTVGAGYDWQFGSWVLGVLADGQFGEIRGSLSDPFNFVEGRESRCGESRKGGQCDC